MAFPQRLAALRKTRTLTQQALADSVGIHVTQRRRYEAGAAQPTLDVLRRLAVALRVSTDVLVFDKDERGPDDELRLQFEALKLRRSPLAIHGLARKDHLSPWKAAPVPDVPRHVLS